MNIFRFVGDLSHLLAIILLLLKIWKTRSCAGISGKSQILFLVVFVTRYLDLLTSFISLYNTTMKLFFIASAAGTVYLMYIKFKVWIYKYVDGAISVGEILTVLYFIRPLMMATTTLSVSSSCWAPRCCWRWWSTTSSV